MDHSLNLKAAERTLSGVTGLTDVRLEVVVDGVNKTLTGQCKRGDFYLRLSPAELHTADAVKSEARTLAFIAGHDAIVATRPFFEDSHAGAAFKWSGETYHGIATTVAMGSPFDNSNKQMSLFGSVLAKLHSIPVLEALEVQESSGAGALSDAAATGPLAESVSTARTSVHAWITDETPIHSGAKAILHGDAWPGNARFQSSSATLFDFEHTSVGDPTRDIANVAWWLTGIDQTPQRKSELWHSFLEGYRSSMNSRDLDLSCLPYHVYLSELRSLLFLNTFIALSPEVEASIKDGTQHRVRTWRDCTVGSDGSIVHAW
ncbi:aminoglycoside phosphotransferase family protein [Rhizobium sp. T1470]|uniref:phosphotransferase family protein n=1 Tax=unclassified Rhizobium TaxID=2613769 RepID=UPI001AAE3B88|nr:aminoglycoside phosphotransferase family protein [Rhizobium sp. T1473]MCA0804186.1 aminoglycoside phosphotransferase family protein [Rhizobium sp. T1473]